MALLVAACGSAASSSTSTSTTRTASNAAVTSPPPSSQTTVTTATGSAGTRLVGPSGHALYLWTADSKNMSRCSGACASAWPPLTTTGTPTAGAGVQASQLGTINRSDGQKQVTYDGHPLYYFVGDSSASSTAGQGSDGFGAKWWLVSPAGTEITTTSTAAATGSAASAPANNSSTGSGASSSWG